MRLTVIGAITLLCAQPTLAETLPSAPGCLHQPLAACVAWLAQNMTVTSDWDAQRAIAAQPQVDVNGKPIAGPTMAQVLGKIPGLGLLPSMPGDVTASMDLAPDKTVKSIEISLPHDPAQAKTAEEYARTGLWQAVNMMVGPPCAGMDEQATYRFFENSVKPTISHPKKDVTIDDIHASTTFFTHSGDIAFCGHKFSYSNLIGTDTNDISLENPHGVSSMIGVSIE